MARTLGGVMAAIAVAVVAVLAFHYARSPATTPLRPGDEVPDVELRAVTDGAPARVRANLGTATVIVFLDTRWPEMSRYAEQLERMNRRYRQRGLRLLAICLDESPDLLRDFIQRQAITFTMLHDPGGGATRAAAWGEVSGPAAYLVDRGGRVVAAYPKPIDWGRDEHRQRVEALLPPPPPGWSF